MLSDRDSGNGRLKHGATGAILSLTFMLVSGGCTDFKEPRPCRGCLEDT